MRIRWTPPAVHDLTRICDYIDERGSAATSRRVALLIYQNVTSLQKFPERSRPGRKAATRELIIPGLPYVVVYRVHELVVEIVRILHGAQQWP